MPFLASLMAVGMVYGLCLINNGLVKNKGYVEDFGIIIFMFALLNLLIWGMAQWMDKQKTEVISTQSDVNINYARAKKNIWKDFWLQSSWATTGYVWVCAISLVLQMRFDIVVLAGSIVYSLVLISFLFPVVKKLREVENCYEKDRDICQEADDDRYWIWGMLYYNPKDKHSMVEKRVGGMGTTVNMATPFGKGFVAVMILLLLQIPVLNVWILMLEFTPIQLSVEGNKVIAEHLREEYVIPMISIKEVELLTELPKMSRNHGTSMEELRKGSYRIKEEGKSCEVFLNPQNTIFIRVETSLGTYYIGGYDDEETREVYEMIKE